MYKIKTKAVGRVAAAAALSFGLAASAVSVASASSQGHHSSRHDSGAFTSYQSNRVEGTVSAYVAGTSISILSKGSTTPVVYALTSATTITGLATGVTLASPDRVVLELSTTTPVTVTSIKVGGHGSKCDGSNGNDKSSSRGFGNGGSVSLSFSKGGSQSRDFGGRHSGGRGSSRNGNFGK
jgi:hypothetical protein